MHVLNMKHYHSVKSLPNHKNHLWEWHILSRNHHMDQQWYYSKYWFSIIKIFCY